jgi:hypothetical protein
MKLRAKCLEGRLLLMVTAAMLAAALVLLFAGTEPLVRRAGLFTQPSVRPHGYNRNSDSRYRILRSFAIQVKSNLNLFVFPNLQASGLGIFYLDKGREVEPGRNGQSGTDSGS